MVRFAILLPFLLVGCRCAMRPLPVNPKPLVRPEPLAGGISGTVRLKGEWWPEGNTKVFAAIQGMPVGALETLPLGEGGSMANVYVAVKSGLGDRTFMAPPQPVVLKQAGFLYSPLVLGLMTRQKLWIHNEDDTMHNVHFRPLLNPEFNAGQIKKGAEEIFLFSVPEMGIKVKCDVHPWERAWIHVSAHPFFAVTGIDGHYSLPDLPPGDHEILAWHERFLHAPLVSKVKVEAGQTSTLDFTFEAPGK